MEQYRNRINRCQPGHGASCSLCCGSHNYTLGQDEIEELFIARGHAQAGYPLRHQEESTKKKLFEDAMQCSHLGMDPSDPGVIRCMIYDEHDRGDAVESFFNGTCKTFYCPAWHELTDRQVLFAARLMGDWYYYSLFINHVESVLDVCARYDDPGDVPDDELCALKEELFEIFIEEDGK